MRNGAPELKGRGRCGGLGLLLLVLATACAPEVSDLPPDRRLQAELGLRPTDRVHEITLVGGPSGGPDPNEVVVRSGDYLQFVSADYWLQEVSFEADSLGPAARAFMVENDQLASPPLASRGARFVLSFVGAPEGRYPYVIEGNAPDVRGAVVVTAPEPH